MAPSVIPDPKSAARPRVLVVDDEPALIQLVADVVERRTNCRLLRARDLREAEKILGTEQIDLLVADVRLPDGDGMSLLPKLKTNHPAAAAVVITGDPSLRGAIDALRAGVVDFLPKPFSADHLLERVTSALARQAMAARDRKRLGRLRVAVKRLNTIRRTITKKVDLLCNDLISAYGELSRQVDCVRIEQNFRKVLEQAQDLEQLLCHAMDWLLRNVGYCNVAVWLASEEHDFELGAYMKYTIPGDKQLTDAMKNGLIPLTVRQNLVLLEGDSIVEQLTPAEADQLKNQSVLSANCTYLGESLAALVMFRDARAPFTDRDTAAVQAIAPIFAVALANVVRHAQHGDSSESNPFYDDTEDKTDGPRDGEDKGPKGNNKNKNKPQRDPRSDADWWKRGEPPPF